MGNERKGENCIGCWNSFLKRTASRISVRDDRKFHFEGGIISYIPEESRIIYRSEDNRQEKIFDALDWLVPPSAGFDITASIVTFPGGFVKKKMRMT